MRLHLKKEKHISKNVFKDIFRDNWGDFKKVNSMYDTLYYDEVIQKMLNCGDPNKMGYAKYICLGCGESHKIAMTCKSSFCLSCSVPYTDRWVDFIGRRLISGATYRHLVLTTPEFLRIYFYRNRYLLNHFMSLAQILLRDVFKTAFKVDLDIGLIVVLQTFGRPGNYNVHLHIIFASGGIRPNNTWKKISYIPYSIFRRKWQYHLLTFLREQLPSSRKLENDIDKAWKENPKGFVINVQKGGVPNGGKGLAKYLAKYLVSPPISMRRIINYDGTNVSYWYHDHETKAIKHETIPVLKFIGRMVQHILPKGFQRIRYYGFHSNVRYAKMHNILTDILPIQKAPSPDSYYVLPRKKFKELYWQSYGENPLLCPRCGEEMELECIWHPAYGMIFDMMHTDKLYYDTG